MRIMPNVKQRSEEWFKLRCGRPTSSQFSRIITATGKPSKQADDYMIELVADCLCPGESDWTGNQYTDRGTELEPKAREEFARIMQVIVEEVGFCTRDDEVAGCSPDGLVKDAQGNYIAGVELKCPLPKTHAKYVMEDKLPDAYKQQVHGSMAVTGLDFWYFMSYCPGMKPFILLIERDAYTDTVSKELDSFLIRYAAVRESLLPKLAIQD